MRFKHRAWIPIAWLLSAINVAATWFAAQPGEATHAMVHALLAAAFAAGAQRLADRRKASLGGHAESQGDIIALREELGELRQSQAVLERLEQTVEGVALEIERVGESQRFLTKVLADPQRGSEGGTGAAPPVARPPRSSSTE